MTTLKEIYLLQERTDLLFVASELVKYYNLKSKVKFGTYGPDEGGYNWDTDTIYLNKYYPKVSEFIITILHEIHHAKQIYKMGRRKFMKKYSQASNMADLDGKDRYWANKWERKAENWAKQEYSKKWKNKF
tara:strand:- start:215 stop:607 length:393 start_codon:yes stop_codon:yes gene_type:complete